MPRPILLSLIFATGLLAAWSFTSWAQVIDSDPCQKSCYEEHSRCVSLCGTGANPIECEATCQDNLEDCLRECR